jgi:hypothetical protein
VGKRTQKLLDLSDEIAAINMRIMERTKIGAPDDPKDRERLESLMEELHQLEPRSQSL